MYFPFTIDYLNIYNMDISPSIARRINLNYFNIDLNNLTDINNYINFLDKTNDYSKYITYYHYIISKRGNKKLNKFNLRIYSKEKI